jgi:hypothetical protein
MLRKATAPVTSAQITEAWLEARGLRTDDETRIAICKRIGSALTSLRNAGTARQEGFIDGLKGWVRT